MQKLTTHFLKRAANELEVETKSLHPNTLDLMSTLPWPGNVRQLENTCRRLTVMASGKEILPQDLPLELFKADHGQEKSEESIWQEALSKWAKTALKNKEEALLQRAQTELESILLREALQHTHGHKQEAAKILGWGRNTLTRKLKDLNIE